MVEAGRGTILLTGASAALRGRANFSALAVGKFGLRALAQSTGGVAYKTPPATLTQMSPQALGPAGGDNPHNNMQPYLTFNFNIALQGVFPPRG